MESRTHSNKIKVKNVFIITSTIVTGLGLIAVPTRYQQTLETIASIKDKVQHVAIVLIDNSSTPLPVQWQSSLQDACDFFLHIGNRNICRLINHHGIKGAGECYMLLVALDLISQRLDVQHRIFKISGRYRLGQNFDMSQYFNAQGRYCFKTRGVNDVGKTFLHTRLWSCCANLQDHLRGFVQDSFKTHLHYDVTIEEAMFDCIDPSLLLEYDCINCEGYIAPWNVWITD